MDAYKSYSVCYQLPTHQAETIVQASSKEDASKKVLGWQPMAIKVRWVIEIEAGRGWV